ncbi:MAG TPA: Asp-tRNA(Asn)/Glu-tRNA(Gln) amidotransferase subunit GatC [Actinomycetaceae bacterium]|nr:Asp-tRNA(Asn)/Glu-tRNA(Gln) amidotransferase subunit GatC [Actinomycetaceae bacterium]
MSSFSAAEVAHLASVAHIELSDDEVQRFAEELSVIAESVALVANIPPEVEPMSHPVVLEHDTMRDDVVGQPLTVAEALAGAPASEDDQFQVPQILGEDA